MIAEITWPMALRILSSSYLTQDYTQDVPAIPALSRAGISSKRDSFLTCFWSILELHE
jgi:hypothetical protein